MKVRFKKNDIYYGQDFTFYSGVPEEIDFWCEPICNHNGKVDSFKLTAPGYGVPGNYGNGAIYVKKKWMFEGRSVE